MPVVSFWALIVTGPNSGGRVRPAHIEATEDPLYPAAIANLRELGGPEMLEELTEIFDEDTRAGLVEFEKALEEGDASAVKGVPHRLKGSSESMGAKRMSEICAKLQDVGASGDFSDARELLEKLKAEFERVNSALAAEVEGEPR